MKFSVNESQIKPDQLWYIFMIACRFLITFHGVMNLASLRLVSTSVIELLHYAIESFVIATENTVMR